MITVRFPNGQAVQYNNAKYCITKNNCYDLYGGNDHLGRIATAPLDCIIEAEEACAVCNPLTDNISSKLEELTKEIRSLKRKINKGVKQYVIFAEQNYAHWKFGKRCRNKVYTK